MRLTNYITTFFSCKHQMSVDDISIYIIIGTEKEMINKLFPFLYNVLTNRS